MAVCDDSLSWDGVLCKLCRQIFDTISAKLAANPSGRFVWSSDAEEIKWWHTAVTLRRCAGRGCRLCLLVIPHLAKMRISETGSLIYGSDINSLDNLPRAAETLQSDSDLLGHPDAQKCRLTYDFWVTRKGEGSAEDNFMSGFISIHSSIGLLSFDKVEPHPPRYGFYRNRLRVNIQELDGCITVQYRYLRPLCLR